LALGIIFATDRQEITIQPTKKARAVRRGVATVFPALQARTIVAKVAMKPLFVKKARIRI
jgi:hypothetical protein